jgi:hypothetical protein
VLCPRSNQQLIEWRKRLDAKIERLASTEPVVADNSHIQSCRVAAEVVSTVHLPERCSGSNRSSALEIAAFPSSKFRNETNATYKQNTANDAVRIEGVRLHSEPAEMVDQQ